MPNRMKEFRGKNDEQLSLALKDTEKHLFQLRFQSATDRLETPSEIRKARRDIARIRTLQREKELAKLGSMSAEQLGQRIAELQKKEDEGQPGKRTAHRRRARLTRFYATKGGKLPIAAPKPEAHKDAAKSDAKKNAPKGSGK
jgi:large subunit ribosomal protein L29